MLWADSATRPEGLAIDEDALQQVSKAIRCCVCTEPKCLPHRCLVCMVQLVEGIALVVSSLPTEQRRQGFAALLQPLIHTAERILSGQLAAAAPGSSHRQRELLMTTFDRMTVIFKYVTLLIDSI